MIKYKDFMAKTRTITVKYQDDTCGVTYRLNALTPAAAAEIEQTSSQGLRELIVHQVKHLVESWEILDEEGKPIGVAESVENLPTKFLMAVIDACLDDLRTSPSADEKKS